jgi:hypothetical protein
VNASLWLVAATWAAAGPMDGSACPCNSAANQPRVVSAAPAADSPSLLDRLSKLFRGNRTNAPGSPYAAPQQTAIRPVSYQQTSASAEPPQTQEVILTSAQQTMPQLSKDFDKKVGNGEDYSWITGQLFFIHADGGMWMVRYASQDQEDKFGGSVVLAPAINMKNFREGDLVCVHGAVLKQERANQHLGGALYRVDRIDLIERAD